MSLKLLFECRYLPNHSNLNSHENRYYSVDEHTLKSHYLNGKIKMFCTYSRYTRILKKLSYFKEVFSKNHRKSMASSWSWNQFSESKLLEVEKRILSVLKSNYITRFVNIKWNNGISERIWTISLNTQSSNTPLVLLHGFAAGIGFWVRNLDSLSKDRPVHAIDLLGFGHSSRPKFSTDSVEAELQMVESIEAWRKQMDLHQFVLLGHSMGGYLATSYAISYPERVKHLILADPWGFEDKSLVPPRNPPFWIKIVFLILYPFTNFNPLASVRAVGPFGPWLVKKLRGDITYKFDDIFEDKTLIPNYIYHCNAQNPTGETAFHHMIHGFGWARNPMVHRIPNLKKEIPITYIHGSDSWMDPDRTMAPRIEKIRPGGIIDIQVIKDAGHHIYADQADQFNDVIIRACEAADVNGSTVVDRQSPNDENDEAHPDNLNFNT